MRAHPKYSRLDPAVGRSQLYARTGIPNMWTCVLVVVSRASWDECVSLCAWPVMFLVKRACTYSREYGWCVGIAASIWMAARAMASPIRVL